MLDIGEHHTEADLDVKIYEKDVLQDAQITDWKSEDESIVTAENGTITAVAEGSAYVVGSYENNECRILVSVYRPQVEMSERVELQKFGANTVTPESEISGAVKDMLLGGENILVSADGNALTYDQAKLPSASADMGDATVVIGTEKAKYVFEAGIYSRVIRTQADLDAMARWVAGFFPADPTPRFFLQKFVDSGNLIASGYSGFDDREMAAMADIMRAFLPRTQLRGVD